MKQQHRLLASVVTAAALFALPAMTFAATVNVTPSNMNGWSFINDQTNATGTGTMVAGPATPPLGIGSAQLNTTSAADGQILQMAGYQGTKFANISSLLYSTYQSASNPSNATAIALQFNVDKDVTDSDNSYQGRIVYEPYLNNGGIVPLGSWNAWDALNGGAAKWWMSSQGATKFNNTCTQALPCTMTQILTLFPNIGIHPVYGAAVLKAGSGWASFLGNTDALTIGVGQNSTTYNFDPNATTSRVTIDKYIDGKQATAATASSSTFPFRADYQASNLIGGAAGSDPYDIGPVGNGSPNPYEAMTVPLANGATYGTHEVTGGNVVGSDCSTGQPYALVGYSTGDSLARAQQGSISTTSPNFTNIQSDKYVIAWNMTCPKATSSTVHIFKYINGVQATPVSANNTSFPMYTSTFNAPFTLGPTGYTTGDIPYEASTSAMPIGSSYSAEENTSTNVVGTSCNGSHPYALSGYSTGNTLSQAQQNAPSTTTPSFTNLQGDKYIIVRNVTCEMRPLIKVHILKYLDGSKATAVSAGGYQFPMMATWQTANLNSGATTSGAYVLGNNHGGAPDQYGADTSPMQTPAYYTTNEVTGGTSQVVAQGAACAPGKYMLLGYGTSSISLADAATHAPSMSVPTFSNLNSDRYVVVFNKSCPTKIERGNLKVIKHTNVGNGTFSFTGTGGLGSFTITTVSGAGFKLFSNIPVGTYTVTETVPSGWMQTFNSCSAVTVYASSTSICSVKNVKTKKDKDKDKDNGDGRGDSGDENDNQNNNNN